MFLLYLLYKFTRPQEKLSDGRTIASAVLFTHSPSTLSDVLNKTDKTMPEQTIDDPPQKQHKDFIDYVTSRWADELQSQVEIGYGFVDTDEVKLSDYNPSKATEEEGEIQIGYDKYDQNIQGSLL